jgi:hypothetical protein
VASVESYAVSPQVVTGLEGSGSQSFLAGDLVKFSAGYVVVATAGAISGIARKDATGTSKEEIPVELIDPNGLYSCRVASGTTHAQTLVGTIHDFTFTIGAHVLAAGTTDTYIVALDPRDTIGATNGRVLVRFKATNYGA